ncbi:MAG TPA: PDZ domain-containing protein [Longimicrobium sp.]|nr:PDZ domain-containing protein [Longimicrobium sp.]
MTLTRIFLAALLSSIVAVPLAAQQRVEYEAAFPNAVQHEVRVTATFHGIPAGRPLEVRMSRASPGRYALYAFAKNVFDLRADDGRGRTLALTRADPHGWRVAGHRGTVRVTYTVWGDRTDGTYAGIDRSHAHLNLPAVFVWARGMERAPVRLAVRPRAGWRVATQLRPTADPTVFTAPNLQWFLDSPVEVGPFALRTWSTSHDGRPVTWRLAVHHLGTDAQVDTFAAMARRVADEAVAVWGEPPGYDFGSYTVIADYLPWASGDAMEHRNSAVLTGRRTLADHAGRVENLGPLAHELFHGWNVERLRPRSLEPFDFERENPSGELWFAEGFTTYYGHLLVRRAGFYSDDEYARVLGEVVNGVLNAPGRRHVSAREAAELAPLADGAVSLDPTNRQNLTVSYYTWGHALGLALDLALRTRYRLTLDHYMRALWREHGVQTAALAPARPYTAADLRRVLGRVTGDTAFAGDFFRRYVDGREVPDFATLLAAAGFRVAKERPGAPYLGASFDDDPGAVFVNSVLETGSLYPAGITSGDLIYSVDGARTDSTAALGAIMARHRAGDVVRVEFAGRGQRHVVPVTLVERPMVRVMPNEADSLPVSEVALAFRRGWLGPQAGARR